ncbi:hypothetical protein BX666DRAFT_1962531 [Dichotomocladium elegans]|nr:hypothetical protein BX666DRAFT_1962531 [Dichotomocladium elegans]
MLTACIWHHNLFPFLYISLCSLETHTLGRGSLMSHLDLQSVIPHNSATCRSELSTYEKHMIYNAEEAQIQREEQ